MTARPPPGQIPNRSAFPPGTRRIRLGIWGLGRGLTIAQTAGLCQFDVVAACDSQPNLRQRFQQEFPRAKCTADVDEFLAWDFEAVVVATYLPNHAPDVIRCLQAQKHVLSEVTAFLTPAEGVALVEAVEASNRVYQLAENYPYTPVNRYLRDLWQREIFGKLQYAEVSYVHDCLRYAYTFYDGSPISPGDQLHSWRSWLPWHYYCTHTLGPLLFITGNRPVRVTALPGSVRLPGHVMEPPSGLAGMAPCLLLLDQGGLCRSLMGTGTSDGHDTLLYGHRGAAEWRQGRLSLRLGGRGHSPMLEIRPPPHELDPLAAGSGHDGSDFWVLYHFANQILNGISGPFDVYRACDITLPGIMAYRSATAGGTALEVPDFRHPEIRDRYRNDHLLPPLYDGQKGPFRNHPHLPERLGFTPLVVSLLDLCDQWRPFLAWSEVGAQVLDPARLESMADAAAKALPALREATASARRLIAQAPGSDAARVLTELLDLPELKLAESPQAEARLAELRQAALELYRNRDLQPGLPQLTMKRSDLAGLPELLLPAGFSLRSSQTGDADGPIWCSIISAAFGREFTLKDWWDSMVIRYDYAPDRILFLEDPSGQPIGTVAAYGGLVEGYLHFLGVLPSQTGRGFGRLLTLAALHRFAERGCHHVVLHTDDSRLPAIKTYLDLGFRPSISHESHPIRWREVAERLGLPELLPAENHSAFLK